MSKELSQKEIDSVAARILQYRKIDTHTHCRDGNQKYKATIGSVMSEAFNLGIVAVGDMPNKDPPITKEEHVWEFIGHADRQGCLDGYYLYIGATKNPDQIKEAARIATDHPKVLGLKFFTAGKDEDPLTIKEEGDQLKLYETLAECGYTGVVAVHCEKQSLFKMSEWDPEKPWTWNKARPPYSQTESVEDQIKFVKKSGFEGTLYILHVTTGDAVGCIDSYRGDISIVCGVTPHNLLKTTADADMEGTIGLKYKINPPIRPEEEVCSLRQKTFAGMIDVIESDHAPHTDEEKFEEPYLSGFTAYDLYPELIDSMLSWGMREKQIMELTYHNAKKIFPKITQ